MYDDEKLGYPKYDDDCKALIEKFLTICLPVTTTPCVKVGKIKTECCGNPIVTPKKYEKCCDEMRDGTCKFTIIQKMKVEIPLDFDADTTIDDLMIDCELNHEKYDYDKYLKCDCNKYDYDRKDDDKCDCDLKDDYNHDYNKKDC